MNRNGTIALRPKNGSADMLRDSYGSIPWSVTGNCLCRVAVADDPRPNGNASAGQRTRLFAPNVGRSASSRKALEEALFLKVKGAPRRVVIRLPGNIRPGAPRVRLSTPPQTLKALRNGPERRPQIPRCAQLLSDPTYGFNIVRMAAAEPSSVVPPL